MPRTKLSSKRKTWSEERDLMVEDYERQVKMKMQQVESTFDMMSMSFFNQIDEAVSRLPHQIREMTLSELLQLDLDDDSDDGFKDASSSSAENLNKLSVVKSNRNQAQQRVSRNKDVTFVGRRTRSHSRSQLREIQKVVPVDRRGNSATRSSKINSRFEITPAAALRPRKEFNLVTPKFKPNTPVNMLRRPRAGEMILSMQGSPILVSAVSQDKTANINVPLSNGNIVSLLPNDGLRLSQVPYMDEENMEQLRILKQHIERVIRNRK